ncbi:MAG: GNAT family N-acetyltransferase [Acidimicrobiia bacterium]
MPAVDVSPLQLAQIRVTAEVLTRAFEDSPIMEYLLPKPRPRVIGMRAFFIGGLVDAIKHAEAWVATVDGAVVGGAVWQPPGAYPPGAGRQFRQMLHLLAVAPVAPFALVRSLRYLRVVEAVHPKAEHWYLATLGVDPSHQGKGYGTRLLEPVLARVDEMGLPTYLETDKERNLAYYARFRFAETDQLFPAASGPPTWTMWREAVAR